MKQQIKQYIKTWEANCYSNGIPDKAPLRLEQLGKVPTYRIICKAILKNDLSELGIYPKTSIYYHELKRIEIEARPNSSKQLKLKL